ncbi:uncharacterized protein LOC143149398 isoform X2 [Ptiloglossa arizonensis]
MTQTPGESRTDERYGNDYTNSPKLVVFFLVLVLGLGHCQDNDLPSRFEIESSINRTIDEVERQLREDSNLPRLTRQEIVKILQNITTQDLKSFMDKEKIERARKLYQRALMVVLPYNADESPGKLNDLYTKPPMTQMIPDFSKSDNDEETDDDQRKEDASVPSAAENLVSTRGSYKTTSKDPQSTTSKSKYKNHRETYSEVRTKVPLKETLKLDSAPVRFTFNLENLQKNAQTTEESTTARYPVYRGNGNSELEIVYGTSVTEQPTTKSASKEIAIDLDRFKTSQNVLTSNQWRYNAPPSTALKPTVPSKFDKVPFLPTVNAQPENLVAATSSKNSGTSKNDSRIAEALIGRTEQPTIFVTPMSTEISPKIKYSSTYSINSGGFRAATTTASMPMRPEVMDLLASIGLKPDNDSNVEDVYRKNKDILDNKTPDTNGILGAMVSGLTAGGTDSASIAKQNTFEGPGSEIKKGVDNLTPDVQLLFQRFGLQSSKLDRSTTTTTTQRTTVNLNSYTNFKPLPTSTVKDQEMKEFLAKFGLGISDNRKQKSMKSSTRPPSLIEAVPGNMRGVLENMGLISSSRKPTKTESKTKQEIPDDTESTETSKFHVFKPHEVNVNDEEQRNKINELLDTVRMVQEGKADIKNVKKVAKDLLDSKILKDGPDPMKLEEILRMYNDDVRNEIKRQQEPEETTTVAPSSEEKTTTLSSMATTESTEATTDSETRAGSDQSSSTTSTTEVSSSTTSNFMALEESFGGTTREPDTELPPRRKSGLYFLVDWNSFLEVGEENKEKINLRFQPKVGDRTRFLPVTVP